MVVLSRAANGAPRGRGPVQTYGQGRGGTFGDSRLAAGPVVALLDLLLTWGAAADPSTAEILEALATFHAGLDRLPREKVAQLHRLLDQGSGFLSAAVVEEGRALRQLLAPGATLPAPQVVDRLESWLTAASRDMSDARRARRTHLTALLPRVSRRIPRSTLRQALQRLADAGPPPSIDEQLAGVLGLDELEQVLAQAAGRGLETETSEQAAIDHLAEVADARRRLSDLCQRIRAEGAVEAGPPGGFRQLLVEALTSAEDALTKVPDQRQAGPLSSAAEVFRTWEHTLNLLSEQVKAAGPQDPADRRRFAEALQAEVSRLGPQLEALRTTGGPPQVPELDRAVMSVAETAPSGGAAFDDAARAALQKLHAAAVALADRRERAAAALRQAVTEVSKFLDQAADQLPAALLAETSRRLAEAEGTARSGSPQAMQALNEQLREDLARLRRLAEAAQKQRLGREQAERSRLQAEASLLRDAAVGRAAARLDKLLAQFEGSAAVDAPRVRKELGRLHADLEQKARVAAAGALDRARKWLKKAGRKPSQAGAAEELARLVRDAEQAIAGEDIASIRSSGEDILRVVQRAAPFARPTVRLAALAATVVIALAAVWAAVHFINRPPGPATVRLTFETETPRPMEVAISRDGAFLPDKKRIDAGAKSVEFDLAPGRYEVWVDRRFTGVTITDPSREREVSVPLPSDK